MALLAERCIFLARESWQANDENPNNESGPFFQAYWARKYPVTMGSLEEKI
jgi:hypothetical protein